MLICQQDDSSGVHQRSQICCVERLSNQRADDLAEGAAGFPEDCGRFWIPLWQIFVSGSDYTKFTRHRIPPGGLASSSGCEWVSFFLPSAVVSPAELAASYSLC